MAQMSDAELGKRVSELIQPILADCGVELVELTCRMGGGRQQLVRCLVDMVGGVTIQQCTRVNQLISQALEASDVIEGSYTVEVSSPGLDRPILNRRDFERALGEELSLQVSSEEGSIKEFRGMLLAVQFEAVVLKMPSGNITVPLSRIKHAKKVIRW